MPRAVLLRIPTPLHGSYRTIAENPPEGFEYRTESLRAWESSSSFFKSASKALYKNPTARDALLLARERFRLRRASSSGFSLVFSLMPFTGYNRIPTILYSEFASKASSRRSLLYRTLLLRSGLKRILVSSPTAAETYLNVFSKREFERLVEALMIGVPLPPFVEREARDTVSLLFVESAHMWQQTSLEEQSFFMRGGADVMAVFRLLNKKYGKRVHLNIRSKIPAKINKEYSDVVSLPNVNIEEGILPREKLLALYSQSDIFLFPGYRGVGLTIPEALSYSLPIVASDSWDVVDYVKGGVDGLVVHRENGKRLRVVDHLPEWNAHSIYTEPPDHEFVTAYADKVSMLIEDMSLRNKLGSNARRAVESGRFSLTRMRTRLGEIFEQSLA